MVPIEKKTKMKQTVQTKNKNEQNTKMNKTQKNICSQTTPVVIKAKPQMLGQLVLLFRK